MRRRHKKTAQARDEAWAVGFRRSGYEVSSSVAATFDLDQAEKAATTMTAKAPVRHRVAAQLSGPVRVFMSSQDQISPDKTDTAAAKPR
jgi:hypothetical protein